MDKIWKRAFFNEHKKAQQQIVILENEYGDLILDLTILFPTKLDSKRIDILRKIFNYTEDPKSETSLVSYHYKDKEDIVKELMNEDNNQNEEEPGCIQQ